MLAVEADPKHRPSPPSNFCKCKTAFLGNDKLSVRGNSFDAIFFSFLEAHDYQVRRGDVAYRVAVFREPIDELPELDVIICLD